MAHQRLAGITSPSFSFQVESTVLPAGEAADPTATGNPSSLLEAPHVPPFGRAVHAPKEATPPSAPQSPGMLVHVCM